MAVRLKVERRLSNVAQRVLLIFSTRGNCSATDTSAWYPLTEAQVRGAIDTLGRRSLIDVRGWDTGGSGREARTYGITAKGEQVVNDLTVDVADLL